MTFGIGNRDKLEFKLFVGYNIKMPACQLSEQTFDVTSNLKPQTFNIHIRLVIRSIDQDNAKVIQYYPEKGAACYGRNMQSCAQ